MVARPIALRGDQIGRLCKRHPYAADLSWLGETLREEGWLGANTRYLESERRRSAEAMCDLMRELSIERVESAEQAIDLIACAIEVFAPPGGFNGRLVRESPTTLRIVNAQCPIYSALEDARWHTVMACPSWHRRRGWIDALGVQASDTVIAEKKWGDAACMSIIDVRAVGGARWGAASPQARRAASAPGSAAPPWCPPAAR